MSERHRVTSQDLDDWLRTPQWCIYASSSGLGSHKTLEVDATSGNPVFKVTDRDVILFIGADRDAAIATYNEAP